MASRLQRVHQALGEYQTVLLYNRSNLRTCCCASKLLPDFKQERKFHVNVFSKTLHSTLPNKGITQRNKDRTPSFTSFSPNLLASVPASGLHMTSGLHVPDSIASSPPLLDSAQNLVENSAALVEPTFSSLGLGGWWPNGIVQSILEFTHVSIGLPWWMTIVLGTVGLRCLITPLLIKDQVIKPTRMAIQKQMGAFQDRIDEASNYKDTRRKAEAMNEMNTFFQKSGTNPLKQGLSMLKLPFAQMFLFASTFIGVRQMAALPVESMKTGGVFWFTDLTVPDPYFILPAVTGLSSLIMFETSVEMEETKSALSGKKLMAARCFTCILMPVILSFQPSALLVSITTTCFLSQIYTLVIRRPAVRQYFGMPQIESKNKVVEQVVMIENENVEELRESKHYDKYNQYVEPFEYKPRIKQNLKLKQSEN